MRLKPIFDYNKINSLKLLATLHVKHSIIKVE